LLGYLPRIRGRELSRRSSPGARRVPEDRTPSPPGRPADHAQAPLGSQITLVDWTVKYAVPLLGVAGAVLFGILRLAYVAFYQQVRATPQEVGYGYQQILAGQLFGTVELTLLLTVVLVGCTLFVRAIRHAAACRWQHAVARPQRHDLTGLTRRCGVISATSILLVLPVFAYLFGVKATYGDNVRNMYLFVPALQLLAIQASPAEVAWTVQPRPGMIDLRSRHCLLYLGYADGIAVFYDVKTQDSLHLPTSEIQLTLPKKDNVDRDLCS
jgi:hypothetical protein